MEIFCRTTGSALVATLQGELDHHSASFVREELEAKFSASGMRNLIFDLSKLQFMDSAGLGVLIGRYKMVSALGGQARIAAPSGEADKLLALSGIYKIIPPYKSVSDAAQGM